MKIKINNARCEIIEFPPSPWDKYLIKTFTKKAKNSFWAAIKTPGWSGYTHFISEKKGLFATGLLQDVLEWAAKENIEVELIDERINPNPNFTLIKTLGDYTLRDYQEDAVKTALKKHRGIIKIPTAGGKTLIAASIIESLKVKTLFLCERTNLAIQTKNKFVKDYKIEDVGIISGKFNEPGKRITIATIQSAHKFIDNVLDFECLILDEMHHVKAKSYIKLLREMKNCYFRFGLSGTPFSEDEVEDTYRVGQLGPMIYEIKTTTLVEEGVIAKPTIRMIEINKPNVDMISPYLNQYKIAIAQNRYRNHLIANFAKQLRGKTLILFKLIEHGEILKEKIPNAIYLDGNTEAVLRNKMLNEFNKMSEGVMLASTIFDEGIDVSHIQHLINASGEKSPIKIIQRLGRGLRADGRGDQVNVIDFMDRTSNILEKHSKKRLKKYKEEGHTVKLFTLNDEDNY